MTVRDALSVHVFFRAMGKCQCTGGGCAHAPNRCNQSLLFNDWKVFLPKGMTVEDTRAKETGLAVCDKCYDSLTEAGAASELPAPE